MRKVFLIFFIIFSYSFTIIDRLPLPDNSNYTFLSGTVKKIKKEEVKIVKPIKIEEEMKIPFKLTGIFKIDNSLRAIINGEPYKVGDKIQDFKIIKIDISSILLYNINTGKKVLLSLEND